jgi:adenylate cyclase
VINLASRIEQLNKQFQSEILISEEVRQEIGESFAIEVKGEVLVKGREKPVRIYAV